MQLINIFYIFIEDRRNECDDKGGSPLPIRSPRWLDHPDPLYFPTEPDQNRLKGVYTTSS